MVRKSKLKKEQRGDVSDLIDKLGYEPEAPQEGLVPLFNSPFYATPDEPADPMDCDRYPDSLYCGNPFDSRFVGIDFDLVADECNLGIQIGGTLGFIKVPPLQIVFRRPDCREEEIEDLPPPLDPDLGEHAEFVCANGDQIYAVIAEDLTIESFGASGERMDNILIEAGTPTKVVAELTKQNKMPYLEALRQGFIANNAIPNANRYYNIRFDVKTTNWRTSNVSATRLAIAIKSLSGNISYVNNGMGITLLQSFTTVHLMCDAQYPDSDEIFYDQIAGGMGWVSTRFQEAPCASPKTPPPPPKRKCCKMSCCPDNSNLERLLKLILKKIGSDNLPATVPISLIKKDSGTFKIQSLAEYLAYSVRQTNAQLGKFPQEIKIKDADLTKEGDQEKTIKLPNLAESIAEIIGILLTLQSESNANLIATISGMIEAGSAKQAASLAVDYAKANSEYLGYKGKQTEKKIPFTFKPGETRLDKMLVNTEVTVKSWENDDKEDLNDALAPLLELAAMWKAANFKNLGTNDTLGKLKSILTGAVDLSEAVDKLIDTPPKVDPNNPTPEPKKNDWDNFIEEAEQGFIAQPGITDTTNPYSRPLAQRPKIREIGNDTSDTDNKEE